MTWWIASAPLWAGGAVCFGLGCVALWQLRTSKSGKQAADLLWAALWCWILASGFSAGGAYVSGLTS